MSTLQNVNDSTAEHGLSSSTILHGIRQQKEVNILFLLRVPNLPVEGSRNCPRIFQNNEGSNN